MNSRPKIKVPLTKTDKFIEIFSFVLLIFLWTFTVFSFVKLPETIPIHFDGSGRPDSFGNKLILFILPLIGSIIYAGINYLNKGPWVFNYMVPITEENAVSQYSFATRMLRLLKCSILLIFVLISLYSYWTANGKTVPTAWWFTPLILGIIFLPLIYMFIKSPKDQNKSSTS